jgi:hypothetical protein
MSDGDRCEGARIQYIRVADVVGGDSFFLNYLFRAVLHAVKVTPSTKLHPKHLLFVQAKSITAMRYNSTALHIH